LVSRYMTSVTRLAEVPVTQVHIDDQFWSPRLETHWRTTIPACIKRCEETGRISNFAKAAGLESGDFRGIYYDDSDVYKVLEGIAYTLFIHPDPVLEQTTDRIIDLIAAAQQSDGYLSTYFTLVKPNERWTDMDKHEMYCAGHLIEAAVAYKQATGKKVLLDVARRLADHIDNVFGPGKRRWVAGHQEIELALVKLYRETGEKRYLSLAQWLLEERGRGHGEGRIWKEGGFGPAYCQDDVPVREIREARGHAVRAMYMYSAMADVAAEVGNEEYIEALERVWDVIINRNMYLTGGVGSTSRCEGFTFDYDLPNDTAYCETCASVGLILWNHRMNLLDPDSKYADVLERAMYNAAIAGVSLSGDRFFYVNPLYSDGKHHRQEWFDCACCPTQVARFVPSIGRYMYATSPQTIWVNLYAGGQASISGSNVECELRHTTRYPYDGLVRLTLESQPVGLETLCLRIPGWCPSFALAVNGQAVQDIILQKGYVQIHREWSKGDVIELRMDTPVMLVRSSSEVKANEGRVAIQRGPLVYCVEEIDSAVRFEDIEIGPETVFAVREADLFGEGESVRPDAESGRRDVGRVPVIDAALRNGRRLFTAIPYHLWDNRAAGRMSVWLPERRNENRLYSVG